MAATILTSILKIVVLNLVLSGDNAVVLGMATANLDPRTRKKALWIGSIGIVILLVGFSIAAIYLMKIPYVQLVGGVLLTVISYRLFVNSEDAEPDIQQHNKLGYAVRTIIVADIIMSLDNVLAVAAVSRGNFILLTIGIAISVVLILFAAQWISHLMERYKWLLFVGAGILTYTAGDMMTGDPFLSNNLDNQVLFAFPIVLTLFVLVIGYFSQRKRHKKLARA